jgi:hypothetical protein
MTRESRELYQGGDEVMPGTYRDLATGEIIHIKDDPGILPTKKGQLTSYEWISGHPDWDEDEEKLT